MKKLLLVFPLLWTLNAGAADNPSETYHSGDSSSGHAGGMYVEPMLIYSQNNTSIKASQASFLLNDTNGSVQDAELGARLGVHLADIIFIAADGRYGRSHFKDSSYQDADATNYNYGATAGVQTPILGVQLWGTYILGGQFDPAPGYQGLDLKFVDARGYRVGAGVHILMVSVNLEYQELTYNNTVVQSFGSTNINSISSVDASQKGYAISVGFPIAL